MGTAAIKHPVPGRVKPSFVIFDVRALWRLALSIKSARMSKITNDGLTQPGTGCFIAVPIWQQLGCQRVVGCSVFVMALNQAVWLYAIEVYFQNEPVLNHQTTLILRVCVGISLTLLCVHIYIYIYIYHCLFLYLSLICFDVLSVIALLVPHLVRLGYNLVQKRICGICGTKIGFGVCAPPCVFIPSSCSHPTQSVLSLFDSCQLHVLNCKKFHFISSDNCSFNTKWNRQWLISTWKWTHCHLVCSWDDVWNNL